MSEFEAQCNILKELKLSPYLLVEHPEIPFMVKIMLALLSGRSGKQ